MWYAWIKIFHIISASLLFGTGLGTAFYMFYVNLQKDVTLIAKATAAVVVADWLFTATSGIAQAVTGFLMIYIKGYSWSSLWVYGSILGYLIAAACWFPVVGLQVRCRDLAIAAAANQTRLPMEYYRCFILWCLLGIPAFITLLGVFYLMANKPEHYFFM